MFETVDKEAMRDFIGLVESYWPRVRPDGYAENFADQQMNKYYVTKQPIVFYEPGTVVMYPEFNMKKVAMITPKEFGFNINSLRVGEMYENMSLINNSVYFIGADDGHPCYVGCGSNHVRKRTDTDSEVACSAVQLVAGYDDASDQIMIIDIGEKLSPPLPVEHHESPWKHIMQETEERMKAYGDLFSNLTVERHTNPTIRLEHPMTGSCGIPRDGPGSIALSFETHDTPKPKRRPGDIEIGVEDRHGPDHFEKLAARMRADEPPRTGVGGDWSFLRDVPDDIYLKKKPDKKR